MLDAPDHAVMIDRITNAKFRTTRLKPGYDEEEVDKFLDQVVAQLRAGDLPEVRGARISPTRRRPGCLPPVWYALGPRRYMIRGTAHLGDRARDAQRGGHGRDDDCRSCALLRSVIPGIIGSVDDMEHPETELLLSNEATGSMTAFRVTDLRDYVER